ncbi:MAG TPA: hypothetical protein VNQ90_04230 [Chthoniobacteraceae bacterium]|nr:hypothetical protein [Chthoniobacteraceae bacterium]
MQNLEQAREQIRKLDLSRSKQKQWLAVLEFLMNAKVNDGISADALAELPEFYLKPASPPEARQEDGGDTLYVLRTLDEMAQAGLIQKNLLMTAFVRHKVVNPSWQILERICTLERAVIDLLRAEEPDPEGWLLLSVTRLNTG